MSRVPPEANQPAFFDLYDHGEATADEIDDFIGYWHEGKDSRAKALSLHDYLGLTSEEFEVWIYDAEALPAISRARRSGTSLVGIMTIRLEEMRAAGRPADGTTILSLGNWLKQKASSDSEGSRRSQALG